MTIGSKIKLGVPAIAISLVILLGIWQLITTGVLYLSSVGVKVNKPTTADFSELNSLLKQYSSEGLVNYAELKHADLLTKAVTKLEATSPVNIANKRDLLAFWINAYNLTTLKLIADHYPVYTIPQLGNGPSLQKFLVGGKPYSTQDIYIRFVTPLAQAEVPKSVFLACGGSIGYPRLPDHALRGQPLEGDAEAATEKFVGDDRNVAFIEKENHVYLSPFFSWNSNIITTNYESLDDFISAYLPQAKAKLFSNPGNLKSYNKPFDWRINDKILAK
jgi:hypothetical protein